MDRRLALHLALIVALLAASAYLNLLATTPPREAPPSGAELRPLQPEDLPAPEPPTALESWHELRGGEPATLTSLAPPAGPAPVVEQPIGQYRPDGHRVYRDRPPGFEPVAIVIHATGAGTPGSGFDSVGQLGRFFARPAARASSHYGVGREGRIARYVAEEDAAFHVATPGWNDISIGIELLNDNSGADPYPPAQLEATRRLVQALARRHDIPLEAIVTHASVQPEDRRDPVAFPWDAWRATLVRS